jgi:hypothetical protein
MFLPSLVFTLFIVPNKDTAEKMQLRKRESIRMPAVINSAIGKADYS